jgi:outer membrane protein OmpA-like peptidoglycan-associated protein
MVVRGTDAIRLCREGGYQQLPFHRAVDGIERLGRWTMEEARTFVAQTGLSRFRVETLDDARLRTLLRDRLRSGELAALRKGEAGAEGESDSEVEKRRLVREIEARSRRPLSQAGRQYRLVADSALGRFADRRSYEVVSHRDAVGVLNALAGQSGDRELARLLRIAAGMLAQDWRPPFRPDGLVLLRKVLVQQAYKPDLGPALTPSQLKQLTQTDWIEVELVDENGEPYSVPYRLELPNRDTRQGSFDEEGFLGAYKIESGTCKLTLDVTKREAEADEAEAETAEARTEAPEEPKLPNQAPDAAPAAVDVTQHFEARLVDELDQAIPGVELTFSRGDLTATATSAPDGAAAVDMAGRGDAQVAVLDPSALTLLLKSRWGEAHGEDRAKWVQADDDTTVVPYRAAHLPPLTARPGQKLRISYQPYVFVARLSGAFFDSNKCFLLPTVLPYIKHLKEIYDKNGDTKLLVVGHTDATSDPAYNDPLSLERAKAMVAYLRDEVDDWYSWYGTGSDKKRWGKGEDKLMIQSTPDFQSKPKGEDPIVWYQKARGYSPSGSLAADQRKALIREYMDLDETRLPAKVEPVAHGCGENFPVKQLPPDAQASWDRHSSIEDRRVELFFFDAGTGIQPPPPGQNSPPGSKPYQEWLRRVSERCNLTAAGMAKELVLLEMHDALFRTDSAVVLPEGEDPTADPAGHTSLTTVGLVATVLRYNEEHPGKKLLVAGHCDTRGEVSFNQELSEDRAQVALALLRGDRGEFVRLCDKRHDEVDVTQIFDWTTRAYGFTCKPTRLDAIPNDTRYEQFRASYNAWLAAWDPSAEPDPRGDPKLAPKGRIDKPIWGAIFDLYEHNLRQELGEDAAGVAKLRDKLVWVDEKRPALGFSEYFPVDNLGRDNYRSQANRRVEVLFFDEGEEPDIDVAANNPEVSEIYLPGRYEREHLEPMAGAGTKLGYVWVDTEALGSQCTPENCDIRFRLFSTDPAATYDKTQTVASAVWEGDHICLTYGDMPATLSYTLEIIFPNGESHRPIQNAPYTLLKDNDYVF